MHSMLPRSVRMSNATDFRRATRSGNRVGTPTLVVHAGRPSITDDVKVGFVVSKAVGNAVTRNRVKRRLRHLVSELVGEVPQGSHVVVRALPKAASEPRMLEGDLRRAWAKAARRIPAERR